MLIRSLPRPTVPCNRLLAWAVLLVLAGCAPFQPPPQHSPVPRPYRSGLADTQAKALYAFSTYRVFADEGRWDEAIAALERATHFDASSNFLQLNLAKALLHRNEAERAIEILRQLLNRTPEDVEARELLGDLLSYRGEFREAVGHYRQALELTPDNEMLQMRLAMALGRMGDNDAAIRVLQALVQKHPEAKLARLSLARFYVENNQPETAKKVYRELLQKFPDQQQAILEYGKLLEEDELYAEAYALYREGVRRFPRAAAVRQQLALLYIKQHRLAEALEQLQVVLQQFPDNRRVYERTGLIHLEMESWPQAEEVFRKLLADGVGNEDSTRYYLGMALLGQGRHAEAMEVMAPIHETSPVFDEAVLQLAYLYKQVGQDDDAIEALRKVLEVGKKRPEIYYYLATFLADDERLEEAAAAARDGLALFPEDTALLYQLGAIYEKQKERPKALEIMERLLVLDPDHIDALNFVAYHQAEIGQDLELALERAKKALAGKRSGYIIDTLGWIYFKMGRYAESREQLEEAARLHPDDPVILEHLGDLYRAMLLNDLAIRAYEQSLESDPAAAGVAEKLRALTGAEQP